MRISAARRLSVNLPSICLLIVLSAITAMAQASGTQTTGTQTTGTQTTGTQAKGAQTAGTQTGTQALAAKPLDEKDNPMLIGKRDLNKGQIQFYSIDREVALGRQLAAETDRASKLVSDPLIAEYVNRVAQNIVLNSDAKVPFTIKVIDSNEVNAFALPGGFLYVNRGVIDAADNEAEMAGRHRPRNRTRCGASWCRAGLEGRARQLCFDPADLRWRLGRLHRAAGCRPGDTPGFSQVLSRG
jgi:predicted Zn-dependent protease